MILATLHTPDLDPFEPASIIAVGIVFILSVLCSRFMYARVRRITLLVGPSLLLGISAVIEGSIVFYTWYHGRSFPDLADYIAGILYLAVGFGLSLANLRETDLPHRLNGCVYSYIYGGYVVFLFMALATVRDHGFIPAIFLTVFFLLIWTQVLQRLNRRGVKRFRVERGLCPQCAYDLRGSVGRPTCPECGAPVERLESRTATQTVSPRSS